MGKKGKRKDARPARARYWLKRTLETKKIHNLVKYCGMSVEKASSVWHSGLKLKSEDGKPKLDKKGEQIYWGKRLGRVPDKYLRSFVA